MESPKIGFEVLEDHDVIGTDSSGLQPLPPSKIQKIRAWLKPTEFAADSSEYNRHLASYVLGTDSWTSEHRYQQWQKDPACGALWIKAVPGAGKSVVAARIIACKAEESNGIALFFFFRQIISRNRTPTDLLRDWLAQLLDRSPHLQNQLIVYLDQHRDFKSVAFDELWQKLAKSLCFLPNVLCVADALDEMSHGTNGNDNFISTLAELGRLKPSIVKVLMTSRPVPRIEKVIKATSAAQLTLTSEIALPAIGRYIEHRLASRPSSQKNLALIKLELLRKSDGLFLYVKLMTDKLLDRIYSNDDEILMANVESLPNGLSDMYTAMLHEHSSRSKVPQRLQIAILRWVTHSARPLRVLELANIVDSLTTNELLEDVPELRALYPNTKAMIRAACGPLIEILEDETVSIIHHSLTEYVVDSCRNDSTSIGQISGGFPIIDSANSHIEIAITCLQYLINTFVEELKYEIPQSWYSSSGITSLYAKYPLLKYARLYWSHHAHRSVGADSMLFDLLDGFMDPKRTYLKAWRYLECPEVDYDDDEDYEKFHDNQSHALHIAAQFGLASYTEYLLALEQDLNAINGTYENTPMHLAAEYGHVDVVKALLQRGALVNTGNYKGLKPLHLAAIGNHVDVIRALLDAGVDPMTPKTKENPRGRYIGFMPRSTIGESPVQLTCRYGHKRSALVFASYLKTQDLLKVAHWAANEGRCEVVLAMLETYGDMIDVDKLVSGKVFAGADVNAKNHNGNTPLHLMTCCPADLISHFRDAGADMETRNAEGKTVLMTLDWSTPPRPNLILLDALMAAGSRADSRDFMGRTVLHHVCSQEHSLPGLIVRLVALGADPHAVDFSGNNLFHYLARHKKRTVDDGREHLIDLALKLGVDPNARNHRGQIPLHMVVGNLFQFDEDTIDFFLGQRSLSNINTTDVHGISPLHLAATISESRIQKLLMLGADPVLLTADGQSLLHIASRARKSNVVGLITDIFGTKNSALIDHVDRDGRTALHHACRSGRAETVRILLEAGADPNKKDKRAETPLIACTEIQEEARLWGPRATTNFGSDITQPVGICLSEIQRPHERRPRDWQSKSFGERLVKEADSVGVRPILRLLLAFGAKIAAPVQAQKTYGPNLSVISLDRKRPLDLASERDCDVLIHELLYKGGREMTPKMRADLKKPETVLQDSLHKFRLEYTPNRLMNSSQLLEGSLKEPLLSSRQEDDDLQLFYHLLRTENEDGLLKMQEILGTLTATVYPHGALMTLIKFGYSHILSLIGPQYVEIAPLIPTTHDKNESASPLHVACERDLPNLDIIRVLVEEKTFDVNGKSGKTYSFPAGSTALHVLAMSSNWWSVQGITYLGSHGANLDLQDALGRTPLLVASGNGVTRNVEILLQCGADPNVLTNDGQTSLSKADSLDICRLLLRYGASTSVGEFPFIFNAIHHLDCDIVADILRSGADPNVAIPFKKTQTWDKYGTSNPLYFGDIQDRCDELVDIYPIHQAASRTNNNPETRAKIIPIIKLLLQHGADPKKEISHGQTIIHALCEHEGILEPFLLDKSMDLELRNTTGNTLLLAACLHREQNTTFGTMEKRLELLNTLPSLVQVLIDAGADITASNSKKENALHCLFNRRRYYYLPSEALHKKDFEAVISDPFAVQLIAQKDADGLTPLLHAIKHRCLSFLDDLIEKGADPLATDYAGNNALHYLAKYLREKGYGEEYNNEAKAVFHQFLDLGNDINSCNNSGRTPLFIALENTLLTASDLTFFVDAGADVKIANGVGQNLLHVVASKRPEPNHQDVEIQKAGVDMWRLLVDKGLDPADEDHMQRTPWDLAVASENSPILSLAKVKG
ncbi:uncharacterized protein KY384_004074 [Bacidia gigantensis]|uniref:uncharacterized protein n=1 Tax=Bacidia gigantensis TaxID=2732470 RepID=UPI001D03654B|nr:uncharacterized protein KY384_004074 [Bacidia gigantensis]KAG8530717.1 hypothetical protein KY384_004074 [Bacidia gigantensis]